MLNVFQERPGLWRAAFLALALACTTIVLVIAVVRLASPEEGRRVEIFVIITFATATLAACVGAWRAGAGWTVAGALGIAVSTSPAAPWVFGNLDLQPFPLYAGLFFAPLFFAARVVHFPLSTFERVLLVIWTGLDVIVTGLVLLFSVLLACFDFCTDQSKLQGLAILGGLFSTSAAVGPLILDSRLHPWGKVKPVHESPRSE